MELVNLIYWKGEQCIRKKVVKLQPGQIRKQLENFI